ncbi:MAG TPA: hypothetical protein VKS79_14385 [Gemmataceae bacterium]|nr:hypothetical protein [Gemmataceae bacterium]
MRSRWLIILLLFLLPCSIVRAESPPDDVLFYRLLRDVRRDAKESEFALMLKAILSGSMMGQGDGWFKPSESRYTWKWLAERYDVKKKGKIKEEDWTGPKALFMRLDRDRNGVISEDDLDWSSRSAYVKQMNYAYQWLRMVDPNNDKKLTREEWNELFDKLAQGKTYLNADDARALLNPTPPPAQFSLPDIPSKATLLKGLFQGELGSACEGPKVGDKAPDFTLKTSDKLKTITLSQFFGKKPVVLVFGSFT